MFSFSRSHNSNMPPKTYDNETLLEAARLVRTGMSQAEACRITGISPSTLNRHLDCKEVSDIKEAGRPRLLSPAQEETLKIWMVSRGSSGLCLTREEIASAVNEILCQTGQRSFSSPPVRLDSRWWADWEERHPQLTPHTNTPLASNRANNANPAMMNHYFNILKELRDKHGIKSWWNADESGVNGSSHTDNAKVYNLKGAKVSYAPASTNREHATIIGAIGIISKVGTVVVPPVVLLKGKGCRVPHNILEGSPEGTRIEYTAKGWTAPDIHTLHMRMVREHIPESAKPACMILDNHLGHLTLRSLLEMAAARIFVVSLPPHTTHVTQPLDVALFGSFKKHFGKMCREWSLKHARDPYKPEFVAMLTQSYAKAASAWAVQSAFKETGIYPFNPTLLEEKGKLSPSTATSAAGNAPRVPECSKSLKVFAERMQHEINLWNVREQSQAAEDLLAIGGVAPASEAASSNAPAPAPASEGAAASSYYAPAPVPASAPAPPQRVPVAVMATRAPVTTTAHAPTSKP
jgi:hypothetical protein